jgi:hypothetical protein
LEGKGRNHSAAASIREGQSACYLQSCKVQAGERYLGLLWAKADPPDKPGGAYLAIRYRDAQGAWHSRTDLEPQISIPEGQKDWQLLAVMVTVPEGTATLTFMAGVRGQAQGAQALFDEGALYRIPEVK